jgi:hypothetical protein
MPMVATVFILFFAWLWDRHEITAFQFYILSFLTLAVSIFGGVVYEMSKKKN